MSWLRVPPDCRVWHQASAPLRCEGRPRLQSACVSYSGSRVFCDKLDACPVAEMPVCRLYVFIDMFVISTMAVKYCDKLDYLPMLGRMGNGRSRASLTKYVDMHQSLAQYLPVLFPFFPLVYKHVHSVHMFYTQVGGVLRQASMAPEPEGIIGFAMRYTHCIYESYMGT